MRIDVRVELGDLVRVLHRRWHLDRTCPVEVVVAQRVSQLVNVSPLQARIVLRHVEMGWQNAALRARCWRHEKVELA